MAFICEGRYYKAVIVKVRVVWNGFHHVICKAQTTDTTLAATEFIQLPWIFISNCTWNIQETSIFCTNRIYEISEPQHSENLTLGHCPVVFTAIYAFLTNNQRGAACSSVFCAPRAVTLIAVSALSRFKDIIVLSLGAPLPLLHIHIALLPHSSVCLFRKLTLKISENACVTPWRRQLRGQHPLSIYVLLMVLPSIPLILELT